MRFILLVLLLTISVPAAAQNLESCGAPVSTSMSTTPTYQLCDLYQRRFAYRQERIKMRDDIEARRAAYIKPRIEAVKAYENDLKALHDLVE